MSSLAECPAPGRHSKVFTDRMSKQTWQDTIFDARFYIKKFLVLLLFFLL